MAAADWSTTERPSPSRLLMGQSRPPFWLVAVRCLVSLCSVSAPTHTASQPVSSPPALVLVASRIAHRHKDCGSSTWITLQDDSLSCVSLAMAAPHAQARTPAPLSHQQDPSRLRLHISPFNSSILTAIVPPAVLPTATDISYHSIQTFPEAEYGFVELPAMEAEKIKKKLHGSILKGSKIRVEKARPEHERPEVLEDDSSSKRRSHSDRPSKKQKFDHGVLPGVELPNGRQVQRGWTKTADSFSRVGKGSKDKKRKIQTSSNTNKPECLFRTSLPPNVASSTSPPLIANTKTRMGQRRVKDGSGRETVIHEFSSTTKYASFLRGSDSVNAGKVVSEYVEGKGWVDEEGNVVEEARQKAASAPMQLSSAEANAVSKDQHSAHSDASTSDLDSSDQDEDSEVGEGDFEDDLTSSDDEDNDDDIESVSEDSSSNASSSSDVDVLREELEDSTPVSKAHAAPTALQIPADSSSPIKSRSASSAGTIPSLSITIPTNDDTSANSTANSKQPHPLERLFKRPTGQNVASAVPAISGEPEGKFSFFEPDDTGNLAVPDGPQTPFTPFTRRDLQERRLRSAAPTPDTAAPGRRFQFAWRQSDGRSDDEDQASQDVSLPPMTAPTSVPRSSTFQGGAGSGEKSFEETFWERRGETNRAWKRRRRETAKERKKRENKKLDK